MKADLEKENGPKLVVLGNRAIGPGYPCYVIAEIGINHNGDIELVKKLIDAAVEAGCDAVKFQKRTIEVVYSPAALAKPRAVPREMLENAVRRGVLSPEAVKRLEESNYENSTNGDQKLALELNYEEYVEIDLYCAEKGIAWFASCWDEESVAFIDQFDPVCFKIASASITDIALLRYTASTGRPIIMSTGMADLEMVERAVNAVDRDKLVLLHTVATYPAKDEDVNLKVIKTLQDAYSDVPVGYSGHELGAAISTAAVALGAFVLERHITLDGTMYGSDQRASIEPHELKHLVEAIRKCEIAMGSGEKTFLEVEKPVAASLRRK